MNSSMHRRVKLGEKEIATYLDSRMVSQTPRPEFVQELGGRLVAKPQPALEVNKGDLIQVGVLTIFGLLTGTLLIVLGLRAVIALLDSLGVLQQIKQGIAEKRAANLNPAV